MYLICKSGLGWCTFGNWTWQFGRLIALWPVHHIWGNYREMKKPSDQSLAAAIVLPSPPPAGNSERGHGPEVTRNTIIVWKVSEFHCSTGLLRKICISELWGRDFVLSFCLNLCAQAHIKSWAPWYSINRQERLSQHLSLTYCRDNFY